MKHTYELTVAIAPENAGTEAEVARKALEALLARAKASIANTEEWGEREFAYSVKKYDHGTFVSYLLEMDATDVAGMRNNLRHEGGLLRWLLIKLEA